MNCSKCKRDDTLTFRLLWLTAEERQKTRPRRLVEVKMVPKGVWRDK